MKHSDPPNPIRIGPVGIYATMPPGKRSPEWYWRAFVHDGGERRKVWSGRGTVEEVTAIVARLVADGDLHGPDVGRQVNASNLITVRHLLQAWCGDDVDPRGDLAEASKANYHAHARRLAASVGATLLSRATCYLSLQHATDVRRKGASDHTVAQDLQVLRLAWKWGRHRGLVPDQDLVAVPNRRRPVRVKSVPTLEEAYQIVDMAEAVYPGRYHAPVLEVMVGTGCRVSEAARLRVGDIQHRRGVVRVTGKTGTREVPVDGDLLDVLKPWTTGRAAEERLWRRSPATVRDRIIQALPDLCDRCELPRVRSHMFRHLAVDRLARAGVDPSTAAELLGHSPAVMVRVYRTVTHDDKRTGAKLAGLGARPGKVIDLGAVRRGEG